MRQPCLDLPGTCNAATSTSRPQASKLALFCIGMSEWIDINSFVLNNQGQNQIGFVWCFFCHSPLIPCRCPGKQDWLLAVSTGRPPLSRAAALKPLAVPDSNSQRHLARSRLYSEYDKIDRILRRSGQLGCFLVAELLTGWFKDRFDPRSFRSREGGWPHPAIVLCGELGEDAPVSPGPD